MPAMGPNGECGNPCGPTPEQTRDMSMRGEVCGTYPRCDKCAEHERALLDRIEFIEPRALRPADSQDQP